MRAGRWARTFAGCTGWVSVDVGTNAYEAALLAMENGALPVCIPDGEDGIHEFYVVPQDTVGWLSVMGPDPVLRRSFLLRAIHTFGERVANAAA